MTAAILFMLAFLSMGCGKKNATEQNLGKYRFKESIIVDGLTRTFLVNVPPDYYYDSGPKALVIALHGGGGSGAQFEQSTGLTHKADAEHFVVVYPDGYAGSAGNKSWNAGNCCGAAVKENINDIKFITQLIDKLIADYKIDAKRVYITGHSNGGMLAYRAAAEISNKITAIAVNSCSMVVASPIMQVRAVPILHMHSIKDTHVPYTGGVGTGITKVYFPPVDSVLQIWANINACLTSPEIIQHSGYSIKRWIGCKHNTDIQLYLMKDGGHSWPGGYNKNPNADPTSKVINANDKLWSFFKDKKLP